MNLLNLSINKISFNDVIDFCQEKVIEGIQLEYKREIPAKGLAKFFASMSNTRGGLIIIGVEEDSRTGLPEKWEGVENGSKLIERINQYVAQVDPLPSYDMSQTDEKEGRSFILIRIFEGDNTPYYVQNDPNIWIRTGNISNPIDIASKEIQEILFKKRENAELLRNKNIDRAMKVYQAALLREETRRQQIIQSGNGSTCTKESLGSCASILTILVQPLFPNKKLVEPQEIIKLIPNIQTRSPYGTEFPHINQETIQEGTLYFNWNKTNGRVFCEQLYSNGLIFRCADVMTQLNTGVKEIMMTTIGNFIYQTIIVLRKYNEILGYKDCLKGFIKISGLKDVFIYKLGLTKDSFYFLDSVKALLEEYTWNIDFDTSILDDENRILQLFIEKMNEINTSFNIQQQSQDLFSEFIKREGF